MQTIDRRRFLGILGALSLFPSLAFAKPRRKMAGDTVLLLFMPEDQSSSCLVVTDPAGQRWQKFPLPIPTGIKNAHSIEVNPANQAELAIFGRQREITALFSLRDGKVRKEVKARTGHVFSGHGMFIPDGTRFLASEVRTDGSGDGFVSIRDSETGEIVGEIHTGAKQPHQMVAMDPQMRVLGISHYGEEYGFEPRDLHSEVTFVDWKSKQVIQRVKKSTHLNAELCHISANPNNPEEFFISAHDHIRLKPKGDVENIHDVAKFFPAPVYWGSRTDGQLREFDAEGNEQHFVYNFSCAISGKHETFGLVHQSGERVSFWDTKTKKLRKILYFSHEKEGFLGGFNASGNQDEFFLSLSNPRFGRAKLVFVNAKSLTVDRTLHLPYRGKINSHMAWSSYSPKA